MASRGGRVLATGIRQTLTVRIRVMLKSVIIGRSCCKTGADQGPW